MRGIVTFMGVVGVVLGLTVTTAVADQVSEDSSEDSKSRAPTTRQYDSRLPPLLPGEEVVTETGQRMRTWSSAGPVPVNPRPTPQTLQNLNGNGGAAIIIDGRGGKGKHDDF